MVSYMLILLDCLSYFWVFLIEDFLKLLVETLSFQLFFPSFFKFRSYVVFVFVAAVSFQSALSF